MNTSAPFVVVENLKIEFTTRRGIVKAIQGVNLTIHHGETVGIVGETGSGKSVTALSIMGLLDKNGRMTEGKITYKGKVIATPDNQPVGKKPSPELAMIFQFPRSALNPIRPIGIQVVDVLKTMERMSAAQYKEKAIQLLEEVQIPDADRRFFSYPFELSGGVCQRVLIAMALARKPALLFADEPTTGLDVITQEGIMALVEHEIATRNMATVLITHNLGLAAKYCKRIAVMYQGQLVEVGETEQIFYEPKHPYTVVLVASTPARMNDFVELAGALEQWSKFKAEEMPTEKGY
jgi:peptide/nickel transport system ATP-binding protein